MPRMTGKQAPLKMPTGRELVVGETHKFSKGRLAIFMVTGIVFGVTAIVVAGLLRDTVSANPAQTQVFPVAGQLGLRIFDEKRAFHTKLEGTATVTSAPVPGTSEFQTEILSMELTGIIKIGNPKKDELIILKIGQLFGLPPSTGKIVPKTPQAVFPATSFFDVFTQIELGERVLHNESPIPMVGSLSNTPAQAAFNSDFTEGPGQSDVFGTDFSLVEAAGGAEAAYTGLNYVFQDFWEFLEGDDPGADG